MNNYYEQDEKLYQAVYSLMCGNTDSYYVMYDLSIKYMYKIIYDIVKDYHTTEDLIQETYITIYNKINTLQDPRKFYAWAGRIATNITLRYIQNNRRELLVLDTEDGDSDFIFDIAAMDNEAFIPESVLEDREKQRLIAEIIDGLSVEQKIAIQYYYYEEMSVGEIANLMGCPVGTVKSRLNYARKAIKDAVIDLDVNANTRLYSLSMVPLFLMAFKAAVEHFAFAGAGVAAGAAGAEVIGANVAADSALGANAGAVGGNVAAGGANAGVAAGGATASGVATGGAMAGKAATGFLAKTLGTLGGKIAAGVIATGALVAGGVAIHDAVTDDEPKDETTVYEASTEEAATEDTTENTTEVDYVALNEEIHGYYMEVIATAYNEGISPTGESVTFASADAAYVYGDYAIIDLDGDGLDELILRCNYMAYVYGYNPETDVVTEKLAYADVAHINIADYVFYDNGTVIYNTDAEPYDTFVYVTEGGDNIYQCVMSANSSNYMFIGPTEEELAEKEALLSQYDADGDGNIWRLSYYEGDSLLSQNYVDNAEIRTSRNQFIEGAKELDITYYPIESALNGGVAVSESKVDLVAETIDPNTTDSVMLKYLEVIRNLCNNGLWPDGEMLPEYEYIDVSENAYGVLDIDGDGRKELAIAITNTSMAGMQLRIFDYNMDTDTLTQQVLTFPMVDAYENGAFLKLWSHNQTNSAIWPYELCVYDRESDSYETIATVIGWDRTFNDIDFPSQYDLDGDGIIYKITLYENGNTSVYEEVYMDEAEYIEWRSQYVDDTKPTIKYWAEPMSNVI